MKIENAEKIIKEVAKDFTIVASEMVNSSRGLWHFEELGIRLIDTINTKNEVLIKEENLFRNKGYRATITQGGKKVCELKQSNFKQLMLQINNILNFKRI